MKMLGADMDISDKRAAEVQLKEIEGNRLTFNPLNFSGMKLR